VTLSCRTGPLRVGRSLRDLCAGLGGLDAVGLAMLGWRGLAVAAEAVD
jgi:hypothetical protein